MVGTTNRNTKLYHEILCVQGYSCQIYVLCVCSMVLYCGPASSDCISCPLPKLASARVQHTFIEIMWIRGWGVELYSHCMCMYSHPQKQTFSEAYRAALKRVESKAISSPQTASNCHYFLKAERFSRYMKLCSRAVFPSGNKDFAPKRVKQC